MTFFGWLALALKKSAFSRAPPPAKKVFRERRFGASQRKKCLFCARTRIFIKKMTPCNPTPKSQRPWARAHTSLAHSSPCVVIQQGAPRRTGRQLPGEHFYSSGPPAARARRRIGTKRKSGSAYVHARAAHTVCVRCAHGVRELCGIGVPATQLGQLQHSGRRPASRTHAACARQQARCGCVQRQEATADGNGRPVSRPLAGMPAVLVTGRQALRLPLAWLPVRRPCATRTGWRCSQATEHGASTTSIRAVGRARSASGRPGGRHWPSRGRWRHPGAAGPTDGSPPAAMNTSSCRNPADE